MMPDWWFYVGLIIFLASTVICAAAAIAKKAPNDVTILAAFANTIYMVIYLVASIVRLSTGEHIAGASWEFFGYLITAIVIPIAGIYWSLLERSRWSNFVLAVVGLVVLVMMFRMEQIWYGTGWQVNALATAVKGALV